MQEYRGKDTGECRELTHFAPSLSSEMPFVKVVKNDAYFSRYQVKYRRRRGMYRSLLPRPLSLTFAL